MTHESCMMSRRAARVVLCVKAARYQLMHTTKHLRMFRMRVSELEFGFMDASLNLHMTVACCKMSRRMTVVVSCSQAARHQLMHTSKRLRIFLMRVSELEFGFIRCIIEPPHDRCMLQDEQA